MSLSQRTLNFGQAEPVSLGREELGASVRCKSDLPGRPTPSCWANVTIPAPEHIHAEGDLGRSEGFDTLDLKEA